MRTASVRRVNANVDPPSPSELDPQPVADQPGADRAVPTPSADVSYEDPALDLAAIERDLAGVERALDRLDDGTYWTDEVTGAPIPDTALADDPVARRAP